MARVRTLKEALNAIKEQDPGTAISYTLIRRLVLTKKVPTMKSGKKHLVDVDALLKYINTEMAASVADESENSPTETMSPIPEKLSRRGK